MTKVYDPAANLLIAQIVIDQGNSNEASIQEKLKEIGYDMADAKLTLILSQLVDKQVLVKFEHDAKTRWKKRRGLRPPFKSFDYFEITNMKKTEANEYVEMMFEAAKPTPPQPIYKDFIVVDAVFEVVDEVAGGNYSGEKVGGVDKLKLARINDKIVIPQSQMYGLIRDNSPLANMVPNVKAHVGLSMGEIVGKVNTVERRRWIHARGRGLGHTVYEVLPSGTQFKIQMRLPLSGTAMKSADDWRKFFDLIATSPIRGLGANPRAFGGRIRPIEWNVQ